MHNTGLVFENAKCIKCGLCVRLCEDSGEEPALCFINRGFVSIISEPLTEDFNNILKTKSQEVIDICPTGALSKFKSKLTDPKLNNAIATKTPRHEGSQMRLS